jgi:hypothetical protein
MRWPRRDSTGVLPGEAEVDAIVETARAEVLTALDRALDTEAILARVYARHGLQPPEPPAAPEAGSQLAAVCDRVGMLEAALDTAIGHAPPSFGTGYLKTVRRSLFELRSGLAGRRLAADEALRLLGGARHNLREAVRILAAQQAAAADAASAQMSELLDLTEDAATRLQALQHDVVRLFDQSGDSVLVPAGR